MTHTPRLGLPYLQSNQAQKHVTLNDVLRRMDTLVQLCVNSAEVAEQPESPSEGDVYILPAGADGTAWAGAPEGAIAAFVDGAWQFVLPRPGLIAFDVDQLRLRIYAGSAWSDLPVLLAGRAGINAEPDAINRFIVKSDAELLSHDDVTPGSGSARKIINKAGEAATASILFQDAFSGRAEIGLTGNDDLSIRVSPDGDMFVPALQVERSTGRLVLHQGALLPDGAKLVNNGTTGAAGVEIEGGGNLGQVSLRLINDSSQGIAGALFTQKSTNPGIDLVDFGFQTLTQRMNVRVEARPAYTATGEAPEFQVFHNLGGGADDYLLRASPKAVHIEKPARLAAYTVASLPAAAAYPAGTLVFVSDASPGAGPAFSDGANWRLITDRSIVS